MKATIMPIKTKYTERALTSQSGLLLVAETIKAYGIEEQLNTLPPPSSNRGKEAKAYLLPILLTLAGGGITMEDVVRLTSDKALIQMFELHKLDSDTLGKWLKRNAVTSRSKIKLMAGDLITQLISQSGLKELTFDPDAMSIESNKSTAEMTYKGFKGYMPLLAFVPELGINIFEQLQSGNTSPATGILDSLKQAQLLLPKGVRFKNLRSDAAGWSAVLINYCDEQGIEYTITASLNMAVKQAIRQIPENVWQVLVDKNGRETDREYAEIIYCLEKTKRAHRLIVQRPRNQQLALFGDGKQGYYVISTNKPEAICAPQIIFWHNGRGNSENYNKEVKYGVNLDYLPTNDFEANKLWFSLGLLVYNLLQALKLFALPDDWKTKKIATLRWQLFQIAGKFVYHAKQWTLALASISVELFNTFHHARRKLYQIYVT